VGITKREISEKLSRGVAPAVDDDLCDDVDIEIGLKLCKAFRERCDDGEDGADRSRVDTELVEGRCAGLGDATTLGKRSGGALTGCGSTGVVVIKDDFNIGVELMSGS
jgi:hypothetical protein